MLISLIYQLKGALSISDVKSTLDPVNEKMATKDFHLEDFYSAWVVLQQKNAEDFLEEMRGHEDEIDQLGVEEDLKHILLIASLANMSNAYRKAAELLVDDLIAKEQEPKQ